MKIPATLCFVLGVMIAFLLFEPEKEEETTSLSLQPQFSAKPSEGQPLNDHACIRPVTTIAVRDVRRIDGIDYPVAKLSIVCLIEAVGRPIRFPGATSIDGQNREGFVVKLDNGTGKLPQDGVGYTIAVESVGARLSYSPDLYGENTWTLDAGNKATFTITMEAIIREPEETNFHRRMQLIAVELGFADTEAPYLYQMVPLDMFPEQFRTPMLSITPPPKIGSNREYREVLGRYGYELQERHRRQLVPKPDPLPDIEPQRLPSVTIDPEP
ncbi:MAG: hypothetical protein RL150_462 [Candidatus Parcubacteria bacterium]|jgi:hypothetical protein